MKKTLITLALASVYSLTATATEYTMVAPGLALGDTTYTTVTGITNGNDTDSNVSSFTFTLTNDLFEGTKDSTNALTTASDGSSSYASSQIVLTSLTLVGKNTGAPGAELLKFYDSSGKLLGSTGSYHSTPSASLTDVFDNTSYTLGTRRWDVSNIVLNVGETYTVEMWKKDGTTAAGSGLTVSYSEGAAFISAVNGQNYQPAGMTLITKSTYAIPEPATATLSLLALAGLAARRRRK